MNVPHGQWDNRKINSRKQRSKAVCGNFFPTKLNYCMKS